MGYIHSIQLNDNSTYLIEPVLYAAASGTTTALTANISNFELVAGTNVNIKVGTVDADATLNVNDTGAKEIRYNNENIKVNQLKANHIYTFVYDGTYWQVVGDIDTDTWRGIQDNLASDSTTDSLSAKQGKVLKGLIDAMDASTPAASGNATAFIDSITQTDGKITSLTKKTIPAASTSTAGIVKIGTTANDAAAGNHNHNSTYSYRHLTDYDFTTTQPLSNYVTFDKSKPVGAPEETWYNGFISSHGNYLASYIINAHRTSKWYVGTNSWGRDEDNPNTAPAPTWYLLAHSGNVETGDNNGQVKIAGQNISVKGLKALAYKDSLAASDIPNLSWNKITSDKPTTLSGYEITDAKIASGVITLGNNTITPVTSVNGHTGSSVNVTAADLGLSNALHFVGITSTTLTDESTTTTLTPKSTGSLSKTTGFVDGDVVMDDGQLREYVWSGNAWRLLGITTSAEYTQPVSTATNTWIAQISQGTDGKITATTGSLNTSGTWSGTASKTTTAENTTDILYLVGVKSSATSTLLHDTSITIKGDTIYAAAFKGNADTASSAAKLTTARNLGVALDSTTAVTFDGSANQTSIPVSGTLGIAHGGTGQTTLTAARQQFSGPEFIVGTWTAASGTWTGVTTDSELYDGKQIILYMPFNGSGNATLNLTLADGTTTGAKNVYFENTTRFTTHKGQNAQLHLIYHSGLKLSDGTTYEGWWYVANRDTDNDYRTRQNVLADTDTHNRSLLLANPIVGTANNNTSYVTYRNDNIYANVSTGIITATGFNGDLTGDVTGNADTATAANLTSTVNAVAYYTDTAGKFGSKASANGALYATSANGALQWGTLPIAQGGTGVISFTKNQVILSDNTNGTAGLTSRAYSDSTSAGALSNTSTNFVTERDVYFGLPQINNLHNYTSGDDIYVPTTSGEQYQLLVSNNTNTEKAPVWAIAATVQSEVSTTADVAAYTTLTLGNQINITSTTAHSEGQIQLYSAATNAHIIKGMSTNTLNYTHILPNSDGVLVQTSSAGAVGGPTQPVYVNADNIITALTFTQNRLYYSESDSSFAATNHYASASQIGLGTTTLPENNTDTLYVNGTTYFVGDVTHNATVYFANGTTYYIDNTGDARLKYLGIGNAAISASYALNIGGDTYINGTHFFGNGTTYFIDDDAIGFFPDLRTDQIRLNGDQISFYQTDNAAGDLYGSIQGIKDYMHFVLSNGTTDTTPTFDFNGHLFPSSDQVGDLGSSTSRWAHLYLGTEDTYGDPYTPVYWNDGVPAVVTLTQQCAFTINSGKSGVRLTHVAITADSYVIQIVVTSGESNLNSAISWQSYNGANTGDPGYIELTCSEVSGNVTGYIMISRGGEITATATDIILE